MEEGPGDDPVEGDRIPRLQAEGVEVGRQDAQAAAQALVEGDAPVLAAVFVMITGVLGAILGPELLRRFGVQHPAARGIALGLTAHAVGTAQALQESDECGAFAALAMSLMGVMTAVLLPLAVALLL